MKKYQIQHFFDPATWTLSYVVWDDRTSDAIIIDSVLDYNPTGSKISHESILKLKDFIEERKLRLLAALDTHAHADHLSGVQALKKYFPLITVAIGDSIIQVQESFKSIYNLPAEFVPNGKQFDRLLKDGEIIKFGSIEVKVLSTPGHTPACSSYLIGDAVFTGDTIFMPDTGTGRCDFPKGSSRAMYKSIKEKLFTLPDETRVFTGHDYMNDGKREMRFMSTIGEEKRMNMDIRAETSEEEYSRFRDSQDQKLAAPRLLYPSIQVNIDAGHLPKVESNGKSYLKIPLNIKSE